MFCLQNRFQILLLTFILTQVMVIVYCRLYKFEDTLIVALSISCAMCAIFFGINPDTSDILHEFFVITLLFSCKWSTHPVVRTNVLITIITVLIWWKINTNYCPFYVNNVYRSNTSFYCTWIALIFIIFDMPDYETNIWKRIRITMLLYILYRILKKIDLNIICDMIPLFDALIT